MTDDERRTLAKKWDDLPPNDEWFVVYQSFQQLMRERERERATYKEDSVVSLIYRIRYMIERPNDMPVFDLLVQRFLENKLLGVTQ